MLEELSGREDSILHLVLAARKPNPRNEARVRDRFSVCGTRFSVPIETAYIIITPPPLSRSLFRSLETENVAIPARRRKESRGDEEIVKESTGDGDVEQERTRKSHQSAGIVILHTVSGN